LFNGSEGFLGICTFIDFKDGGGVEIGHGNFSIFCENTPLS
jgi:hypothetical protein